jgi:hypothetical protein
VQPGVAPRAEVLGASGNGVVVRLTWRPVGAAADEERYEVLVVRGEKVRRITDHRTIDDARRAASRAAGRRRR